MAAGTWYLVEQCGQTVHGTACEEKLHSRAPKREAMCEQEKLGLNVPEGCRGMRESGMREKLSAFRPAVV